MSVYRRRNHEFDRTLAQRADDLRGTLTADSFQTKDGTLYMWKKGAFVS